MNGIQIYLTPAAGKKLIAKALVARPEVQDALHNHTIVLITGTTNADLAEELLTAVGAGFEKRGFYRGITKPAAARSDMPQRQIDVVIEKGVPREGLTIFDVSEKLTKGDIIFKGANAVHVPSRTAGILIGHPYAGTIVACQAAAIGRRATLIHPVGLEKRVDQPVYELAALVNAPDQTGPRLYPAAGTPYTELDALRDLCGVEATLIAAGGVCGYEGGVYLQCCGDAEALARLQEVYAEVKDAPAYEL